MFILRPHYVDQDAELISSNVTEADYTEWAVSQSITTGDYRQVTTVEPNIHKVYQAVQSHTTAADGNEPWNDTDASHWVEIGSTNRWAMFNSVANQQTINTGTINATFDVDERVDGMAFINIYGDSLQVIGTDDTEGEIYNKTFDLYDNSNVSDWYSYFFEPILRKTDLFLNDIPLYPSTTFQVIIDAGTADAKLGIVLSGLKKFMGLSQYGASFGIVDYSVKETNAFGDVTLTQRAYSKTMTLDLTLTPNQVDDIYSTLSTYRSTPLVWVAADEYAASIVYGYYRDFDIQVQYSTQSMCSLEIEGLT